MYSHAHLGYMHVLKLYTYTKINSSYPRYRCNEKDLYDVILIAKKQTRRVLRYGKVAL